MNDDNSNNSDPDPPGIINYLLKHTLIKTYQEIFSPTAKRIGRWLKGLLFSSDLKPSDQDKGTKIDSNIRLNLYKTCRILSGPNDPLLKHQNIFVGRSNITSEIANLLKGNGINLEINPNFILNIHGAPGIGKTEACKEAIKSYLLEHPGSRAYYLDLTDVKDEYSFYSSLGEALIGDGNATKDFILQGLKDKPGLFYLDNFEDLAENNDVLKFIVEVEKWPNVNFIMSSRTTIERFTKNILINKLDLESSINLFLHERSKTGGAPIDRDSSVLEEFLERDLDCHPLAIVLTAAQSYYLNNLSDLISEWNKSKTSLAELSSSPLDKDTSLNISIKRSFDSLKHKPETIFLWGVMLFFPQTMTSLAFKYIENNNAEINHESLRLLIKNNILRKNDNGDLVMLSPLRQFMFFIKDYEIEECSGEKLANIAYSYFMHALHGIEQTREDEKRSAMNALRGEFINIEYFVRTVFEDEVLPYPVIINMHHSMERFYKNIPLVSVDILATILKVLHKAKSQSKYAEACHDQAECYMLITENKKAIDCYKDSIWYFKKVHDHTGLALSYYPLGLLHKRLRASDLGNKYLDLAQDHVTKSGRLGVIVQHNMQVAVSYTYKGNYDDAMSILVDTCKPHLENLGDGYRSQYYLNEGEVNKGLQNIKYARLSYDFAIKYSKRVGDENALGSAYKAYGHLENGVGNYKKGKGYYKEAIGLFKGTNALLSLSFAYIGYAESCHYLGEIEKRDEFISKSEKTINKTEYQYEIDRISKRIEAINR